MKTSRNHDGFTLIELLVVISMTGVVLAITIPAIVAARSSAAQIRSVAYARDSATTIFVYAADNGDRAPVVAPESDDPDAFVLVTLQPGVWFSVRYFTQCLLWHGVMMSRGQAFSEGWFNPSVEIERRIADEPPWRRSSDYTLSQAYMARPGYWVRGAVQRPGDRQPVTISETAHPSSKSLLIETWSSVESRVFRRLDDTTPIAVAMADGSASARAWRDATEPVPNTLTTSGNAVKLVMTENGVLGIDFRAQSP